MNVAKRPTRALGLISGGLDSMLAARLLMEQGVAVTGIAFTTPFFGSERAEAAARHVGFPLVVSDITGGHLEIVRSPPSGYGSQMNPCIDCHALMLREAGGILEREGYDLLFTGEVLGERPMSQSLRSLNRVANLSGYKGLVLRPLSALLLAETVPERDGRVDRSRLLDIQGRSRRRQFELAERLGISEYPTPAGGCLLTDPSFSRRLRDLLEHGPSEAVRHLEMLRHGRHFRLRAGVKAIVGRNAAENAALSALRGAGDVLLRSPDVPGPTVVLVGSCSDDDVRSAARLCARYSDGRSLRVRIEVDGFPGDPHLDVQAFSDEEIASIRL